MDARDLLVLGLYELPARAVHGFPFPAVIIHLRRLAEAARRALALVDMIAMPAAATTAYMSYPLVLSERRRSF